MGGNLVYDADHTMVQEDGTRVKVPPTKRKDNVGKATTNQRGKQGRHQIAIWNPLSCLVQMDRGELVIVRQFKKLLKVKGMLRIVFLIISCLLRRRYTD